MLISAALGEVFIDAGFPGAAAEGFLHFGAFAFSDSGYGFLEYLVVDGGAGGVAVVIGGAVAGDTHVAGDFDGVDVGAEEEEFPVVFFFLALDHALDVFERVFAAGVFEAVGGDDK